MKKVLFLFTVVFLTLACEGPMGPQGPKGDKGDDALAVWDILDITVSDLNWEEAKDADGNPFYLCTVDIDELTPFVYDMGTILLYREISIKDNDGNIYSYQQVLPYTRHYKTEDGEEWTQTIDYEFSDYTVTIYVTNSNFKIAAPSTMFFRLVLMS